MAYMVMAYMVMVLHHAVSSGSLKLVQAPLKSSGRHGPEQGPSMAYIAMAWPILLWPGLLQQGPRARQPQACTHAHERTVAVSGRRGQAQPDATVRTRSRGALRERRHSFQTAFLDTWHPSRRGHPRIRWSAASSAAVGHESCRRRQ